MTEPGNGHDQQPNNLPDQSGDASEGDATSAAAPAPLPQRPKGKGRLLIAIIIGVVLGIAMGLIFPAQVDELGEPIEGTGITSISFLGHMFLNALFMLVVPLVMVSMINGIAALGDVRKLGKIGTLTIAFYFTTTFVAVILGIFIAIGVQPGNIGEERSPFIRPTAESIASFDRGEFIAEDVLDKDPGFKQGNLITIPAGDEMQRAVNVPRFTTGIRLVFEGDEVASLESIARFRDEIGYGVDFERLRGELLEPQLVESGLAYAFPPERSGTYYIVLRNLGERTVELRANFAYETESGQTFNRPGMSPFERIMVFIRDFVERLIPRNLFAAMSAMEILPIIIFSLLFGAVLTTLGSRGERVLDVVRGLFEAMMKMVHVVMYFAPIGIFALVADRVAMSPDLMLELQRLSLYVGSVIGGLAIHALIVLPLLLFILTGRSPLRFAAGMGGALVTAFSTASSAATLPATMDGLTYRNKVSKKSTEFVTPLGATINMDGTALYEAVAVIFMAQLLGFPLDPLQYVIIFITATLAAIGAAGIPEAGLVTMVMVLLAVGLPVDAIAVILAIDWFLDRCRTTVNVWGDSCGAAIIDVHALGAPRGDPPSGVPLDALEASRAEATPN